MNTWITLRDRIQSVDIEFEAEESFNNVSKEYTSRNNEQMFSGKLSTGEDITPEYALSTIAAKKRKGQPYDRVTLRDTGDFYTSRFVFADQGKIVNGSDVQYSEFLVKRYGEQIYGLDTENRKDFTFGPYWGVLKRRLENISGLKFN